MSEFAYKFSESKRALRAAQTAAWIAAWTGTLFLAGYIGWTLTASQYEYTFLTPSDAPGQLRSDRWSADFWFTFTLPLLFVLPISAGFMVDGPQSSMRPRIRIVVMTVLFVYFVISMGWFASYYVEANKAYTSNSHNPANDERWCCLNRNLDPIFCTNLVNTQCTPSVGQNELHVNNVFLFKFWVLIILLFLMLIDFVFTVFVYMPVRFRFMELLEETVNEQNLVQDNPDPLPADVFQYSDELPVQQKQRSKRGPQQQQQQQQQQPQQNQSVVVTGPQSQVRQALYAHQQRQQQLTRAATATTTTTTSKLGVQSLYKQRHK